jgi:drug/metabolite transporter (DMT)-like permease
MTLPAGAGAVLNASTPLFTAVLGILWLGQRSTTRLLSGLALGLAAVIVLVGWSPLDPSIATITAVLAALGAALSYAIAGTFVRRALPGVHGVELATGQLVAASILLLLLAIASGAPSMPSTHARSRSWPSDHLDRPAVADLLPPDVRDQPDDREHRDVPGPVSAMAWSDRPR